MRGAGMLALAFFVFTPLARAGDVEDVLRRLPLKGVESEQKKDAPLPTGANRNQTRAGAPAVHPFVLKSVTVEGATVFDPAVFHADYGDYLLRTIGADELAHIVEAITAHYRQAGYFLSRAIIPAQDIADGHLRIEIVEGYVASVTIEGDAQELKPYADDLLAERPARLATLERALFLMGDVPGVRFKASRMAPDGDGLAAHRLIVTANRVRFEANFFSDNRGRPEAGELEAYARGSVDSLIEFGDRLSLGYFTVPDQPDELQLGEVNYVASLGHSGAMATFNASISRNDQGESGPGLDNEADSTRFFGQISYPLIRSREQSLWVHGGIEKLHIRDEVAGALAYQDDVAIVHAAVTLRQTIWDGVGTVYLEVADGFAKAPETIAHSRADADGRFVKAFAQTTLVEPLGSGFSVFAEVDAQASDRPLFSAEEFALGGPRIGRGYDTGEITGEDGVGGVIELRYFEQLDDWLGAQVYGFYDGGIVWNDNTPSETDDAALSSTGAGVRLSLPYALYLTYEAAKPLTRVPAITGDKDVRHFFSLSFSL